jgi:hypothetical protein
MTLEGRNRGGNPADNLSAEARRRGGLNSAKIQKRNEHGQFAGSIRGNAGNLEAQSGQQSMADRADETAE